MIRKILPIFFLLAATPTLAAPGDLLKVEAENTLENIAAGRARSCPTLADVTPQLTVKRYKVTYETRGPSAEPITATGLVMIPATHSAPLPILSYQHGTIVERNLAPSYLSSEGVSVGYCFASLGMVASLPDYLGLGDSPLDYHPYHHALSQASAAADLLMAVRKNLSRFDGVSLNGQLFLAGYSQGGHATMSLHKYLDERGITVTASAPMAGAYDLGTSFFSLLDSKEPNSVVEVTFAVYSLDRVYGILANREEAFLPAYAKDIPELFNGHHGWREIFAKLPATPREVLQPAFLSALRANANHPFIVAVKKNDLYDWKPAAPVRFIFGALDKEVPIENSKKAYARMKELGADVSLFEIPGATHATAHAPAFGNAALWFQSLQKR